MVKGVQRRLFLVKTPDNSCFEEAYFILRPGQGEEPAPGRLSEEAARVIAGVPRPAEPRPRRDWFWFGAGTLAGGGLVGAVFLICLLL